MNLFNILAVLTVVILALAFLLRSWWKNLRGGQTTRSGCPGCGGCGGEGSQGAPLGDLRDKS
ncbi:MAG: FeoB-associated Cys-rich membrane protein [Proteobacteria bacterium]|nr:FeoB-associated Cys-rich membrane protein [Pseudomonadota bacterium]